MFKIVYSNFSDRIKMNLILAVQIIVILILTNIIVSSFYGRYMLYRPFEYILSKEGVMFTPEDGVTSTMWDFSREDIENICDNLIGDTVIHMSYDIYDSLDVGESENIQTILYVYEDEFFNALELPLAEGKWDLSESSDYISCVIGPNKYGIKAGDYIETEDLKIRYKVESVLTDITYEPVMLSMGANVKMMFNNYSVKDADHLFMITKYSLTGSVENHLKNVAKVFIDYEKGLSDEEIFKNNSILVNKGQALTYNTIRKNSKLYIYKDLRELFPVILGAVIVICIGIISAVSVSTESQFKKYKIFYLCGCTKKKCVLINVLTTNITIALSAILSSGIIMAYRNNANAESISLIMSKHNLIISGIILLIFELLVIIIPSVLIGKKSVKELLYD